MASNPGRTTIATHDGKPRRKTDGRELLLDVARSAFLNVGYDAVSMQQLSEAAGMTKGAPYYHFKGKDDLFVTVFVREVTRLRDALTTSLDGSGSLRERLKIGVQRMIETTPGDFDQLVRDFQQHFGHSTEGLTVDKNELDLTQVLIPHFASAHAAGEFSRLDADRAVEFFMLLMLGQFKAAEYHKSHDLPVQTSAERANDLVDLLFDGI